MSVQIEALEDRRLFSTLQLSTAAQPAFGGLTTVAGGTLVVVPTTARITHTGTLLVQGTSGKDRINIAGQEARQLATLIPSNTIVVGPAGSTPNTIYVEQTFADQSIFQTFDAKQVKRIYVEAG